MTLPVTALIVTKNETDRIETCITALGGFEEIIVVDFNSDDDTAARAMKSGEKVTQFNWNGLYPKKQQWCLDHVLTTSPWVFYVDADEIVTPELLAVLATLDYANESVAGYFIPGRYTWRGKALAHGLRNNKLCLLHRGRMEFPVVDDLDIPGMGEIEGHYQPVLKKGLEHYKIGQIKAPLLHHACDDPAAWEARHQRYAQWEAAMNARNAWPPDPSPLRQAMKTLFRRMPLRPAVAFIHCYIIKLGFLDGLAGLSFALSRTWYYRMIAQAQRRLSRQ